MTKPKRNRNDRLVILIASLAAFGTFVVHIVIAMGIQ